MLLKFLFQRLKKHQIKSSIEICIKNNLFNAALNLARDYDFLNKEIEIYETLKQKGITSHKIIERLEKVGELKKAFEFSKLGFPTMNLQSTKRIYHDLKSNDSYSITKDIFANSGKTFWKELYFARETNNYSEINERVAEWNLMNVDNPSWDYAYARYTRN